MDGKKSPTTKPSDFSYDRIERSLAEEREFLRRAEEDLRLEEDRLTKSSAERTEWQKKGAEYLARCYKNSEKRRTQFDKELKEGSIQRREFQAKVHKLSMTALSLREIELTEALAAKAKTGKPPQESTGTCQKQAGRKTDDKITNRNNEIATLLAAGKPLLEIAKHLDARGVLVPYSWMIVEDDGTPYPVKNFEKAYYDLPLRKKLRGLVYDVKRSHAKVVG